MAKKAKETGRELYDRFFYISSKPLAPGAFKRSVRARYGIQSKAAAAVDAVVDDVLIDYAHHFRKSGDPYFTHVIAAAWMLLTIGKSHRVVIAGLLHDHMENLGYTFWRIAWRYGFYVALLVWFVSRNPRYDKFVYWRKLRWAFKDAVCIKIVDRINNLLTLWHVEERKQVEKIFETRLFYTYLARRYGVLVEELYLAVQHAETELSIQFEWRKFNGTT